MRQPASRSMRLVRRGGEALPLALMEAAGLSGRIGMGTVIAISSLVAKGGVGLRVTVPALQRLGHDAIAFPTMVLSSHLGFARVAGTAISPETLAAMIDALDANAWLERADAIITGYQIGRASCRERV